MQEILDNLKLMHEAAREEYEKSKKCQLGLDEHKALQASFELLDETLCGAEKAVEKQIPKQVIKEPWVHDDRFSVLICPSCGSSSGCESSDGEALNFCNDCGQAIK